MNGKDIIIQEINENSEYKHSVEYGEGRFMTNDAVEAIAESLVKKLNLPVVDYCNCDFVMIMRDVNTDEPYCAECGKLIKQL